MWILMMISILTLKGQPIHVGFTHYLDGHGSLTIRMSSDVTHYS
jgi:hypothetical protein